MPPRLEGKGSCTQGYGTGDLPDQGKKLRVSNPTRLLPKCVDAVSRGAPQGPLVRATSRNMSIERYTACRGLSGRQLLGAACRVLSVERQRGPSGRQLLGAACRELFLDAVRASWRGAGWSRIFWEFGLERGEKSQRKI